MSRKASTYGAAHARAWAQKRKHLLDEPGDDNPLRVRLREILRESRHREWNVVELGVGGAGGELWTAMSHMLVGRVIGVDVSPDMSRESAGKLAQHPAIPRVKRLLMACDARGTFLPSEFCHILVAKQLLNRIPPNAVSKVVAESRRITQAGGRILAMAPGVNHFSRLTTQRGEVILLHKNNDGVLPSEGRLFRVATLGEIFSVHYRDVAVTPHRFEKVFANLYEFYEFARKRGGRIPNFSRFDRNLLKSSDVFYMEGEHLLVEAVRGD